MAPAVPDPSTPALPALRTVIAVAEDCSLTLDDGTRVRFQDLRLTDTAGALDYLRRRVLRKKVFLRDERRGKGAAVNARVILKNRISINAQLVKAGFATRNDAR